MEINEINQLINKYGLKKFKINVDKKKIKNRNEYFFEQKIK
jgi:hypothetical protein